MKPAEAKAGIDVVIGTTNVGIKLAGSPDKILLWPYINEVFEKYTHVNKSTLLQLTLD